MKNMTKQPIPNGLKADEELHPRLPGDPYQGEEINLERMSDMTWRIFRIMSEFIEGFQFLSQFSKEVTIFGSARTNPDDKWYKEAEKLGKMLAEEDYTVITGGGPGVMEAANKGANEVDPKKSVGINIELPGGQRENDYIVPSKAFHYFFTRKVMLAASAQSYVFFPGGFGTLDECFEMITLIQTGKMQPIPLILMGQEYWGGLVDWIKEQLLAEGRISDKDFEICRICNTAEEAMEYIRQSKERTIF